MSHWITETLIATSLLMLAVLALRNPVSRWFGPRIAYLLWLAPALRMVLPPLPESWFRSWFQGDAQTSVPPLVSDAAVMIAGSASPSPVIAEASGTGAVWLTASLTVWLGGALLFLGWHILHYRRFAAGALAAGSELDRDLPVRLVASPIVSSPVALGIFGRKVIVPEDFEFRYDKMEQRLALSHEVTHHRRGDLTVNFAALAMLSLHWFNPIAHLAHRAFRLDQEAACDAVVLDGASREERLAYGTALYKSATGQVPLAACAMGFKTTLKLRLRRIAHGDTARHTARFGMAATLALITLGLGFTATRGIADPGTDRIEPVGTVITKQAAKARAPEQVRQMDQAETRALAAEKSAERAQWKAEAAREQAEKIREKAEGLRVRVGDEATEAAIERAEAMAEAARDAADQAREQAMEAAEAAAEAANDAAEAAVAAEKDAHALAGACRKAMTRQIMSQVIDGRHVMVVQCDNAIAAYTNARTREALTHARKQIETLPQLNAMQKAAALKGLDRAIRDFALPVPPAAPDAPAAPLATPVPPRPLRPISLQ